MIVFLDTNILGFLSTPSQEQKILKCQNWFEHLLVRGVLFTSSELCFYEVKRSLILAQKEGKKVLGIEKLEELRQFIDVLIIDKKAINIASEVWADSQLKDLPNVKQSSLDIDTIIVAHFTILMDQFQGQYVVIATENIKHLGKFAEAQIWQNIKG
jgi:hypothetical protein